jgi:serine/threonine protein kinase
MHFVGLEGEEWSFELIQKMDKAIWKARDKDTQQIYVLKEGTEREMILSVEAEKLCSTLHYYDIGTTNDKKFLVMDYSPLPTLKTIVRQHLSEDTRKAIALNLVNELYKLHEGGLIHGDLKPANVLISGTEITLIDFGGGAFYKDGETGHTISPNFASFRLCTDFYEGTTFHTTYEDELETIVYMVWFIVRNGRLPWLNNCTSQNERMRKVIEMKLAIRMETPPSWLRQERALILSLLDAAIDRREDLFPILIETYWPNT